MKGLIMGNYKTPFFKKYPEKKIIANEFDINLHHKIQKCHGGSDNPSNLVMLPKKIHQKFPHKKSNEKPGRKLNRIEYELL